MIDDFDNECLSKRLYMYLNWSLNEVKGNERMGFKRITLIYILCIFIFVDKKEQHNRVQPEKHQCQ